MRIIWVATFAVTALACRGTTGPSCTDAEGRGSDQPDALNVSCSPVGSDLQCSAIATNVGGLYVYCPVTLTVTDRTVWTSSNAAVAAFGGSPPGLLKVLTPGQVSIDATYGFLHGGGSAMTFAVAPAAIPERMIQVSVIVEDSQTAARVPEVIVEVAPERGPPQTCVTGQFGSCLPFLLVLSGTTRVKASKAGYVSVETSLPPPSNSLFQSTVLTLVRQVGLSSVDASALAWRPPRPASRRIARL